MSASRWPAAWMIIAAIAAVAPAPRGHAAAQDPQMPTFRAVANAVMVDVSVRDRNRRVLTGLGAADFEVYDNGVLQALDIVSYGKLPIDLTVALDVSFSVTGQVLERLRRGVVQLMRELGRNDRLKLVLFNMQVSRSVDFTTDEAPIERAIRAATAGGGTSLLDSISVSLVSSSPPDRRQLIVFFTDGQDSISVTTPDRLTSVAQRARATLTFVMPGPPIVVSPGAKAAASGSTGIVTDVGGSTPVVAALGARSPFFQTLAAETGGSVVPVSASTDLAATFKNILDGFRSSYVLYYNATGVDRSGYHTVEVRVKKDGAVVQARRGYANW